MAPFAEQTDGSSSFRSSLSAHSPKRQFTVHRPLRSDNPGADLSQGHLVPTCSDEGRVVRPCPTQLPQAHDNGARRTTDLAPRRLQAHQSLLSSPGLVQIGIIQLPVPPPMPRWGSTLLACIGSHSCVTRRQVRERPTFFLASIFQSWS